MLYGLESLTKNGRVKGIFSEDPSLGMMMSKRNNLSARKYLPFYEDYRKVAAKPQLKSESLVLLSTLIRIVFGNEVSSTPILISSLERTTWSLFFETSII